MDTFLDFLTTITLYFLAGAATYAVLNLSETAYKFAKRESLRRDRLVSAFIDGVEQFLDGVEQFLDKALEKAPPDVLDDAQYTNLRDIIEKQGKELKICRDELEKKISENINLDEEIRTISDGFGNLKTKLKFFEDTGIDELHKELQNCRNQIALQMLEIQKLKKELDIAKDLISND